MAPDGLNLHCDANSHRRKVTLVDVSTGALSDFAALAGEARFQTVAMKGFFRHRRRRWMMLLHMTQIVLIILHAHHQTETLRQTLPEQAQPSR